jgi:hypothetical protein
VIHDVDYEGIAERTGKTLRTIRNHVDRLLEMRWLVEGVGGMYLRGILRITQMVSAGVGRSHVWIDSGEGRGMKARLITGLVAYLNKCRAYLDGSSREKRHSGIHSGGLALGYVANCVGRSRSWVGKWFKRLVKLGWLERRLRWVQVDLSEDQLDECRRDSDMTVAVRGVRWSGAKGIAYEYASSIVCPRIGVRVEIGKKRVQ